MAMNSKKRKFLATSLTATMVAAAVAPAAGFAAEAEKPFPDVELGTLYTDPIMKLKEAGVIEGNPDGTFGIRQKLTRAQAALMFTNIRDLDTKVEAAPFADVKQGVWYSDAINAAYAEGVISGNPDGTFNPNGNLTRAQFARMVVDAYGLDIKTDVELPFTDVKEDAWYTKYIKTLYANDLIAGKTPTTFAPGENVDRGDFAILLANTDVQHGHKLKEEAVAPEVVSVSAINQKTLEVKGDGLKNLKVEDVTVEGNNVTAVNASADGKTATLTLQAALVSGQATKVTIKEAEETKEFTVTYELKVSSVEIEDQVFDDDRANQRVKFKVNGVEADIEYLTLNGYSITFVAKDANTGAASSDLFAAGPTSSTGEIANPAVIGAYTVEVQVTKSGEALVTDVAEVSVVNLDAQTTALENPVFYNHGADMSDDSSKAYGAEGTADDDLDGDDFVQNSTIFVAGESFELLRLYGTVAGEKELIPEGDIVVTSSNDAVVSVGANNVLTAESAGNATLTFKVGAVTKTVNVTVTNAKRVLTKVTANPTSLKLVDGYGKSVTLKSTDQYGDPYSVSSSAVTEVIPQVKVAGVDTDIVSSVDLETDVADSIGTMKLTITGTAVGKGSIFFKDTTTDKVLGSLLVDVSAVDNLGSLKLERIGGLSADNTLELGTDPTIVYELARYNTQGVYVEPTSLKDMIIEVVDGTVATVQFHNGTDLTGSPTDGLEAKEQIKGLAGDVSFVITAKKAGKTDVLLKDPASGKQQKLTITVTANPFKVTNVDFKAAAKVDYAGATIDYTTVLNVIESNDDDILTGVTLNKATQHKVRISEAVGTEGIVYLDTNANGVYDSEADVDLGFLELTSTTSSKIANGPIANAIAGYTTALTDKGTLLFKFLTDKTDATTAIKATSVQFEVK